MSESEEKKKRKRTKYLLKSVLRVDVDLIMSVHFAEKVDSNTKEWGEYMKKQGGLLILPGSIMELGKKSRMEKISGTA